LQIIARALEQSIWLHPVSIRLRWIRGLSTGSRGSKFR